MTGLDLAAIRARAEAAFKEIDRLCAGGRWTMSIPVKDTDSDLVISDALEALLDHVDTLTKRLEAVRELHRYYTDQSGKKWCDHCAVHVGYEQFDSRPWPCPTIQAIEGDQ